MKAGIFFLVLLNCFTLYLHSQEIRGIKPVSASSIQKGITRAIIIGISDYQDPLINDLKYAHKDAEVFARFLVSSSGGQVKPENIKLLINEQATYTRINLALEWLLESSKKGDQAIVYFAGHGDVENKIYNDPGYLLVWDSPNRSYFLNAISVSTLQGMLNKLSIDIKSKVILITDACRSGKLAGTPDGPRLTANSMLDLFKNQILILSCQPDEISIEGEQWGGGRGVFSYYFVKGLSGAANTNQDSLVTVLEIGRYLQDHVSSDVKQYNQTQTPITQGNLYEVLSYIPPDLQKQVFNDKDSFPTLLSIRSRYLDEKYLNTSDTSVLKLYKEFEQALAKKEFLFSVEGRPTADELFKKLMKEPSIQPIQNYLSHNYAAALQDDAQEVLNSIVNVDINEITKSKVEKLRNYKNYPLYLNRASELLGETHFIYRNLKARQYFFEGLMLLLKNTGRKNEGDGVKVMNKFRQSLQFEPYGPHTYFYMMCCQAIKFENMDSAIVFAGEAEKCSPAWVLPYAYLSFYYSDKFNDTAQAKKYLELAETIDSQHIMVLTSKAAFYYHKAEYQKANVFYKRIVEIDSTNENAWLNLGVLNLTLHKYGDAEVYLGKAIHLDSMEFWVHYYLAVVYSRTLRAKEAEVYFLKAIKLNPIFISGRRELARLYRTQKRNDEAEKLFREIIIFDSSYMIAYYELACLAALKNHLDESLKNLEFAFKNGFKDFDYLMKDEDLINIRNSNALKLLIERYQK